jgi:hypothetical protein
LICEIVLAHFQERIFDSRGTVDPQKLDAVARMGGDFYCRAHGENIFEIPKPTDQPAIGVDQIPPAIRNSSVFTGNDIGRLGNIASLPEAADIKSVRKDKEWMLQENEAVVHQEAQKLLRRGELREAWKLLLAFHQPA